MSGGANEAAEGWPHVPPTTPTTTELYTPEVADSGVTVVHEEVPLAIPLAVRFPGATIVRGVGADSVPAQHSLDRPTARGSGVHGDAPQSLAGRDESDPAALHHRARLRLCEKGDARAAGGSEVMITPSSSSGDTLSSAGGPVVVEVSAQGSTVVGQVVLVVGPTGSGKSAVLHSVGGGGGGAIVVSDSTPVQWDPQKAVVSQFGGAEIAQRWLGGCGLNSIPSWVKPYHVLSTGERVRADLARRLQMADAAKPNLSVVVLDDFGHSLDTVTRASCAVCAARAAREHSLCLVVATALPDVASWLQPDVVLQLPPRSAAFSSSPAVVLNEGAGTRPEVRIAVRSPRAGGLSEQQGLSSTNQPLPSECTRSHTYGATEAGFQCDPRAEQTLHGGVVVVTSVDCDDATSMCNQLFDTQFTGETAVRVPDFPSVPALGEFWVGLIVGPSGSGKSLIRRHVFGDGTVSQMRWPAGVTVEGLFDSVEECTARLAAVGLDADGIRAVPHANLSRGETHLVAVARLLVGSRGGGSTPNQGVLPIVCLDEFTCALDRAAAGALARGVADWARRQCTARYVVMTCHDDLDGALAPDWVYHTSLRTCYWRKRDLPCREDLHSGMLTSSNLAPRPPLRVAERLQLALATVGRSGAIVASVARPTLCLHLRQCALSAWQVFREHHYKNPMLSADAELFVVESEEGGWPVGCVAVIRHNGSCGASGQFPRRAHRTVVLPAWQGLGIGGRLSDAVGELFARRGCRYFGQTVHPLFGAYRDRSALWNPTEWNHQLNHYKIESWKQRKQQVKVRLRAPRKIYSHEFAGTDDPSYYDRRGITFSSRLSTAQSLGDSPQAQLPSGVADVDAEGARNPFELFCRVTNAAAANGDGAATDRKTLVAQWQRLPATDKAVFIEKFRKSRLKPSTKDGRNAASVAGAPGVVSAGPPAAMASVSDASIVDVVEAYASSLGKGEVLTSTKVSLLGFVTIRREHSRNLVFFDLVTSILGRKDEEVNGAPCLQVVLNRKRFDSESSFEAARQSCCLHDEVRVIGFPGKTRTGTGAHDGLSLIATAVECLAPLLSAPRICAVVESWGKGTFEGPTAARLLQCDERLLPALLELATNASHATMKAESAAANALAPAHQQQQRPLTGSRLGKLRRAVAGRQRGLFVVLEQPNHPGNVAAVMRNADAFGATEIVIVGEALGAIKHQRFRSQSSSANKWVKVTSVNTVADCLDLVGQRCLHFGTAVHSDRSTTLNTVDFNPPGPSGELLPRSVALWFGNEVHGLTAEALAACGVHVYLPMTGVVESLNLSVTVGIVLWEVARQRALLSHLQFGLAGPEQDLLVARLTDVSRGCVASPPVTHDDSE